MMNLFIYFIISLFQFSSFHLVSVELSSSVQSSPVKLSRVQSSPVEFSSVQFHTLMNHFISFHFKCTDESFHFIVSVQHYALMNHLHFDFMLTLNRYSHQSRKRRTLYRRRRTFRFEVKFCPYYDLFPQTLVIRVHCFRRMTIVFQ